MTARISVNEIVTAGRIIDVRSPSEYAQGHIPGSVNLPLLTDEGRAVVGTLYKQQGAQAAYLKGVELTGPRLAGLIQQGQKISLGSPGIYCWRGGLRSQIFSTLLDWANVKTSILSGGYKAFRRWVLEKFQISYSLKVLGGMTGVGKTSILKELARRGEQVIDLEALSSHRGSAFGLSIDTSQPSNEHFENLLAVALHSQDISRPIWIEDESRMVGHCKIPDAFFSQIEEAELYEIAIPSEERLERLLVDYGNLPTEYLKESVLRLHKRLGGVRTKNILCQLHEGKMRDAAGQLMDYYDKMYARSLDRRKPSRKIFYGEGWSREKWVEMLLR